ncbi:MAG: hypothetical protein KA248_15605 [Kiritimatiellae bacterium]|nr:hypothetical protein [Kiritimatiellia bacterium]
MEPVLLTKPGWLPGAAWLEKGREVIQPACAVQHGVDPVPAMRLYTGLIFQGGLTYDLIREMTEGRIDVLILSGCYGVVHGSEPIRPYESDLDSHTLRHWIDHHIGEVIADFFQARGTRQAVGFFTTSSNYSGLLAKAADVLSERGSSGIQVGYYTVPYGGRAFKTPPALRAALFPLLESVESAEQLVKDNQVVHYSDMKVVYQRLYPEASE